MTKFSALIEKLQAAPGPDREIDLAIAVLLQPEGDIAKVIRFRRGFDGKEGMAWDLHSGAVCFEKYTADGRCTFNGGYPLARYTESIDAALTLRPPGSWWIAGEGQTRPDEPLCGARILKGGAEDMILGEGEHPTSPAIAMCIAALRAREEG